jgi:formylglycine-generating enzyme required for sulfatase activity
MGFNDSKMNAPDRPVEKVTWFDAVEFCRKLSELDPRYVYRLPTESEWEYACRSGTASPFYWDGEDEVEPEGAIAVEDYGWHYGNSGSRTRPVAQKSPNAWGLYDMHGNVWEWCLDEYVDRHPLRAPPADRSAAANAALAEKRVVRGGSWITHAGKCRSACRKAVKATDRKNDVGLRIVRVGM